MTAKKSTATTPDKFDFADWFGNADAPEESCDIFTATHLVGEINALQRQIEEDDRGAEGVTERTLSAEMSPDEERLAELYTEFLASKRTVFIRGLDQSERRDIRKAHEASGQPDEDFALRCLSKAIVALKRPGQPRTDTRITLGAMHKLHRQIGEGQMALLVETYQNATSAVPQVDADFLRRRSGQGDTEE